MKRIAAISGISATALGRCTCPFKSFENILNQAYSEYKHSLTFRVRRYVVTSTKPVHWSQIRPTVHN